MSAFDTGQYKVKQEPFYKSVANEVELHEACLQCAHADDAQGPDRLREIRRS